MSSGCNATELKANTACDAHLRNVSNTCKKHMQPANKMGCLHAQLKLRECLNKSMKTDALGKLQNVHCKSHKSSSFSSMSSIPNRSNFPGKGSRSCVKSMVAPSRRRNDNISPRTIEVQHGNSTCHQIYHFQTWTPSPQNPIIST